MIKEEVLSLLHQNGIGQDIKCILGSKSSGNGIDFWSIINNYKINKDTVRSLLDKNNFEKHKAFLLKNSLCEIKIKKEGKYPCQVCLYCSFIKAEDNSIYSKIFKIEYLDDEGNLIKIKYESF